MLLRVVLGFLTVLFSMVAGDYPLANAQVASPNITVNLPSRTLELYSGNDVVKEYPVAIGKPSTPTPLGRYSVIVKEVNPAWYPPDQKGKVVPSGPANPLGYRWIGIWNNYGIHGTNAPWSIGNSVSNGCIRMQEADVEELFDHVDYGTPVIITYERVKIRINVNEQVLLSVYPDVYGYGAITRQDIRNRLKPYRLNMLVTDDLLRQMLADPGDQQVAIAQLFKIKVNGKQLSERGLFVQDKQYVPVYAVAGALNYQIKWDEKSQTIQYDTGSIPGIVGDDVVFVSVDSLTKAFACAQTWYAEENSLEIDKMKVLLNENPVNFDVKKLQGMWALPAVQLAEAMGRKVNLSADKQTLIVSENGKNVVVPIEIIGSIPYIKISNINKYFDAYVYWNEAAKTIELTYP